MRDLALWGGHECTVNRIGDQLFDQTELSGHHDRPRDLDLFASLGVQALRYPVLWERTAPDRPDERHWRWPDARLGRLAELGLRPIVGLVHHGAGPLYTDLLDKDFAAGLADFAEAVARRYPWVEDWTPVNEPLTTARFSALYGLWHPHLTDERAFWTALLNQVDAIGLSMARVRLVNPAARLIQTEDLGRTYGTAQTAGQAAFDNQRRWMTWDLLCGDVTSNHPFWERMADFGLADRLRRIADAPCPPDVIGVNHYPTSDRLLDHRLERYPPASWGGNGEQRYADIEAVRALEPGPGGLEGALIAAAARYGRTLAVTETHMGCARAEQLRWLLEAWRTALRLRRRGVDIEAVTAWALLGSHNWESLLTRSDGCYESGAFDVRAPAPRPTAVAATLRVLSGRDGPVHPVAEQRGWWRRDTRLAYPPVVTFPVTIGPRTRGTVSGPRRPLLITGATGTLGRALARACKGRGIDHVLTGRDRLALGDRRSIDRTLEDIAPWAVINAAGWVKVDEAEAHIDDCLAANAAGAARLARACADRGVPFVGFSSDLVFDGGSTSAYVESDIVRPLNVYGASKARAEREILPLGQSLIIRTAAFFSTLDPHNFAAHIGRQLAQGREALAPEDLVISPTYVPDLVEATLDLLIDGETGLWHLANRGAVSWAGFGRLIAEALAQPPDAVRGIPWRQFGWAAERPARVPLASERGQVMPSLEDAVRRYGLAAREQRAAPAPPAVVDEAKAPSTTGAMIAAVVYS